MSRKDYLGVTRKRIPDKIMRKFNLDQYINKNVVYFQVNKGMYGIKEAGLLARGSIVVHLAKYDITHTCHRSYLNA